MTKKMEHTIIRESYAVGAIANSLYVNYGAYGDNFSIIVKKGSFSNIFNLEDAEIAAEDFVKILFDKLDMEQKKVVVGGSYD